MPRTTDIRKYPPEFALLLSEAAKGPVPIPDPKPWGLRGYLQAYLRALELEEGPRAELARSLQVISRNTGDPTDPDPRKHGPHVLIQKRSDSIYARRIAAAIGKTAQTDVAEAGSDFLKRLSATTPTE